MTEKLSARQLRKRRHEQMLRAYEKNRRRNLLAQPGAHDFVVVLDHLKAGYNVPKIFRSAEAFGAREVQLIGIGPFDPSPAKGAFRQVPASCRVPCDYIPKRSYPLFRTRQILNDWLTQNLEEA